MNIENIIFEKEDTVTETAIKTTLIWAGTSELGKHLKRLKITHTKVERRDKVVFVLRGASIGRIEVVL